MHLTWINFTIKLCVYPNFAQILADTANRALSSVFLQVQKNNGFRYYVHKSFHEAVGPILDYASEEWGYMTFPKIDAEQYSLVIGKPLIIGH